MLRSEKYQLGPFTDLGRTILSFFTVTLQEYLNRSIGKKFLYIFYLHIKFFGFGGFGHGLVRLQ